MTKLTFLKILTMGIFPALIVGGFALYFMLPAPEEEAQQPMIVQDSVIEEIPLRETVVIGNSVEGREIEAVTFGKGEISLLFVGGIHGGYEWNSSLLAYEMIDYFTNSPQLIPTDVSIGIIPVLNPDGLAKAVTKEGAFGKADVSNPEKRVAEGRFNANGVDLNRNFDCKWAPESTWRGNTVSAGSEAFSEPEAQALRNYIGKIRPEAVVFWHSKANNVYASECTEGILPRTLDLMNVYADAAAYGKVEKFDAYPITGDAEGWLASIGIPAVTVELESASSIEWERNLAGVEAVLGLFSEVQ